MERSPEFRSVAQGGAFNRSQPTLRLGIAGDGGLENLRQAFAFARREPVAGRVRVQTLLEAPVSDLLIRSSFHAHAGRYARAALSDVSGRVDYHAGSVVLEGLQGHYGPAALSLGGRFRLGRPFVDCAIVVGASAPGRSIPFAENLAPEAQLQALAFIGGGARGFQLRGTVGLRGPAMSGAGTFALDERGVGEFGPLSIERRDGSTLLGAMRVERPTSRSAAWVSAREFRIAVPQTASRLSGVSLPAFPPLAGTFNGAIVGAGTPDAFALAGDLHGRALRVGKLQLGSGTAAVGGFLDDVRLSDIRLDGPLGRIAGSGAAARGIVALQGTYAGSLERLVPLTGNVRSHGALRGPLRAEIAGSDAVVQSSGAMLHGGSFRGVTLDAAAGTLARHADRLIVVAALASIGGRRVVAAQSHGGVAISAPDVPSTALLGTGIPLERGNVSAYGLAVLGNSPAFDGTVAVANGRTHGYRVAGDAQIDLDGPHARIFAATGKLGSTYGALGGNIDGIGSGALRYDVRTHVPLADLNVLAHDLALGTRRLSGSFDADLRVSGIGSRPVVQGRISAPEGTYNGLAFRSASAGMFLDPSRAVARAGTVKVGSTTASFSATRSGRGAIGLAFFARDVNLADFNDYFDADDTLGGRGRIELSLQSDGRRTSSRGAIALRDVRYHGADVGTGFARWEMHGPAIVGEAGLTSAAGRLRATARAEPGGGYLREALASGRYDVAADFGSVDLGHWLAITDSRLPLAGTLDGRARLRGRWPRVSSDFDATLSRGTVAGFALPAAHLHAASAGSRIDILAASADVGFARLTGSGTIGLAASDPLTLDVRATAADVEAAVHAFVPSSRSRHLAGSLDAAVRVSGTRNAPKVAGGFDLEQLSVDGLTVPRAIGALALSGNALELRDADVEFARGQAFVAGSLPLLLTPFSLGPLRAPLSFDVTARSVDLAQFSPLLPFGTTLGGTVDGRFGVEGTVERPRLLGSAELRDASYSSALERTPIEHVDAQVRFTGNAIELPAVRAQIGGGTLSGTGHITLPLGSRSKPEFVTEVTADAAKFDFPAFGRGILDGRVLLSGTGGDSQLSGDVSVRNAVIPVSAVYGSEAAPNSERSAGFRLDPTLNLHVAAGNDVRVRNAIVDVGVEGGADVTGSVRTPLLSGGFNASDGTISSYNHTFRIVNATVSFNPADGTTPTIDARAISRVSNPDPDPSRNISGSANVIVTVSGTADSNNLQVTYSSDPAYSQEQIVGLLLDVPALLRAVNFNLNAGSGASLLRGAPGETNVLLPPGVTPQQVSAISFNQEVFSLLNGQLTQRALGPLERAADKILGLSDIEFTVDYGGGIGYSLRRQLGKRDFYTFLSQTVTYPERVNLGFELVPKPYETVNFSYYAQNGVTSLITNQTPAEGFLSSTRRLTSVQPLGNRSGVSLNFNRRF